MRRPDIRLTRWTRRTDESDQLGLQARVGRIAEAVHENHRLAVHLEQTVTQLETQVGGLLEAGR